MSFIKNNLLLPLSQQHIFTEIFLNNLCPNPRSTFSRMQAVWFVVVPGFPMPASWEKDLEIGEAKTYFSKSQFSHKNKLIHFIALFRCILRV